MEQLYFNGNILTMSLNNTVEAILVKDGIISKTGTLKYVKDFSSDEAMLIDLKGKTLLPSFIDSHSHLTAFAGSLGYISLDDVSSFEDLVTKLIEFKKKKNISPNEWIIGFSYDNNNFPNCQNPTKEILDLVSCDNPILISHVSGHMGVANSKALELLHITEDTKDPTGGKIGRVNNSKEPNGYLEEAAFINIATAMPQPTMETLINQLEEAQNLYLSYGITTVQDGLLKGNELNLLKYASTNKKLKLDTVGYIDIKNCKDLINDNSTLINKYLNRFKIGGYKLFLDGSPQGKTAWLTKPYNSSTDGYRGYPIYKDEEVLELVKTSIDAKLQLLTHCNGDAAADQLIKAFKDSGKNISELRPVMIHAQTVREDQLPEMKSIGLLPSFFIAHTYYWGDIHITNLGLDRASNISPVNSAIKLGLSYTFHQDTPVIMPNMLETVWCAVTRVTKNNITLGNNQRISPYDALKAITINAAYQYFEEDIKGSIEEGKLADLVILDQNPLTIDPMEIRNIQVLETIKDGVTLWKA